MSNIEEIAATNKKSNVKPEKMKAVSTSISGRILVL